MGQDVNDKFKKGGFKGLFAYKKKTAESASAGRLLFTVDKLAKNMSLRKPFLMKKL